MPGQTERIAQRWPTGHAEPTRNVEDYQIVDGTMRTKPNRRARRGRLWARLRNETNQHDGTIITEKINEM